MNDNVLIMPSRKLRIGAKTLSLEDVKNIYRRLASEVSNQADREIEQIVKKTDQSDEDFEKFKVDARAAFKVTVTITGENAVSEEEDSLYGESVDVFDSPNIPERISSIFMTNATAYRSFTRIEPANRFELFLDFF